VPRGVLVGLTGAIKLTPLAFVTFFLVRRERRAALTAIATFALASAAGAIVFPGDSWDYWTSTVRDTDRVGNLSYAGNQSIRGVIERLDVHGAVGTALWIAAALAVGLLALWVAFRLRNRGDDHLALLVIGAAALVDAPVSWTHHWLLAGLALALAAASAHRPIERALIGVATVIYLVGPQWLLEDHANPTAHWTAAASVVGNAYVWLALAFIGWATVRCRDGSAAATSRLGSSAVG
jgi:alpha-1,2-mannosyltransferase